MKRILMTLLCLVGLTGLAGVHQFDKTKFGFAEGFNGGTLVQDKLLLQITSGDQLAYFKQGDKRPDGHIITDGEEGFYAGFKMGWNYTTWAYANVENDARFDISVGNGTQREWYTGTQVQNGAIPGLSITTAGTIANKYVTSFTYWGKIDPTALVADKTYSLRLHVMSYDNLFDNSWGETEFTIQVLVGKDFVLRKPDGEQVYPAVTKLFEKHRPNHPSAYETQTFCGGIQQAYVQAIQMAVARAKNEKGSYYTEDDAVVDAYITMESPGTLDPNKITSPKRGKIIINLNGNNLTLEHSLPNTGCVYEFRDAKAKGTGSVDCKEEFILATDTTSGNWSQLIVRGGTFKNDLADPKKFGSNYIRIYGGTFYGGLTMANLKEGFEQKIPCWGVEGFNVEFSDSYCVVKSHIHHWKRINDADAIGLLGKLYNPANMAVLTCEDADCPVCKQLFVVSFCQEGGADFFAHTYPCNVRYFNGQETRFEIVEQKQLKQFMLGAKPEEPDFFSSEISGAYGVEVMAKETFYTSIPVEVLGDAYENLAKNVQEYCTQAAQLCKNINAGAFEAIQKTQGEIGSLEFERMRIEAEPGYGPNKEERINEIKKKIELLRQKMEDPKSVLCKADIFKMLANGALEGVKNGVNEAKKSLNDSRSGVIHTVNDALVYNPGKYDLSGVLYIENTETAEPGEHEFSFKDAFEFEVLPLRMNGITFAGAPTYLHAEFDNQDCKEEPYTGTEIKKRISAFTFQVDGEMTLDGVNSPYYFKPWFGITLSDEDTTDEDVEDAYARHGFAVLRGDSGKNPGEYYLEFGTDHDEHLDRADRGESAGPGSDWSDPFYASSEDYFEFAPWTILDAPVMVQVQTTGLPINPFLTLQDAVATLKGEDITARITQDLFNDGRADNVTVPAKYGLLDLGGTCGLFTLDLQGYTIGAEAEPGAFTCIINNGKMKIIDTMKFDAVNVGAAAADEKVIVELAKKEVAALVGNKLLSTGTVYGQVINNGTMTIGTEPLLLASGSLGMGYKASPVFKDAVSNSGTMTIYGGTFERGFVNVAGTTEILGGVFEGPISGLREGITISGGMFKVDAIGMGLDDLQAMLAPGYQVVEKGDFYVVVPHEHVYELEMLGMIQPPKMLQAGGLQGFSLGGTGFTLTCTNDPICLVRKGEFRMKSPEDVNKLYDREPLDAVPYVCTITDDVTGEQKEVSLDEFIAAFEGVLSQTSPITYINSETKEESKEPPVKAGHYEAGLAFVASNVVVKIDDWRELRKSQGVFAISPYQIKPVELTSVELNKSEFKYDGSAHNVAEYRGRIYAGSFLIDAEYNIGKDCVAEAVGSPSKDCTYPFIVDGKSPNTYGSVTNYWTIYAPSGNFAGNAATEALNGNEPCGDVTGNPDEGFSLFVTNPQNMVYDAATSTWFAGLTVTWPYKTALLAANREYTPAGDAYFLSSTDPTNVVTAAQIRGSKGEIIKGSQMDVSIGKDGISDVPGVKQFTWWVEINKDDAKKAKAAYETVQAEAGARDALETNGVAIAQQLVNAQTICAFIANGLEKDTLVLTLENKKGEALPKMNEVRNAIGLPNMVNPEDVTPEVVSNHMAVCTVFADYIATGDEDKYVGMTNLWAEVFGTEYAYQPTGQEPVAKIMNNWAKIKFKDRVTWDDLKLPEGIGYDASIMPACARNLFIVENYDHMTYTLTAWGLVGDHSPDGVKATDFKVIIPSESFELVEDNLANAVVALKGDESFDAAKAAYKFDRKSHFVTVPETIQLGVNTLQKNVDFTVEGEGVNQTGSEAEDCFYSVTLKAIDGRGIIGEKTLRWCIIAPSGKFGNASVANGATGGIFNRYELTFKESSLDNNGLVYYTADEAKAAGLTREGWYAAMKVVVPVDGVDFMKPSILYFSANGSGEFTANSCKDAINEFGVKSEVTEDISTWWYPCVRSFTWWSRIDADDVAKAIKTGNTSITNAISAYGLAWEGSSDLIDLGSAGIRQRVFRVVVDVSSIKLRDHDNIQYWPVHDHNYAYEVKGGTNLVATCNVPDCPVPSTDLILAVDPVEKTYDQQPVSASLVNAKAFEFYTKSEIGPVEYYNANGNKFIGAGAPVNAGTYTAKVKVVSKTDAGNTTVTNTLFAGFSILPVEGEATLTLNPTSVNYTGRDQTTTATVKLGGTTLKEGAEYKITGNKQVGSSISNATYTVTAEPSATTNVLFAPVTATWTIVAPSGSFPADALSAAVADDAPDYGEVEEGTNLVITATTNLVYDAEQKCWLAGFEIKWPADIPSVAEQAVRAPTYTDLAHATVEFSTMDGVYSLADIAAGKVEIDGFDWTTAEFYRVKNLRNETYVKGVEWIVPFTLDQVMAAVDAGEAELSYEIAVMGLAWENNANGLKRTTYKITLPLDDLLLWDDQGRQKYPLHKHNWRYEASASEPDGAITNTLTATCVEAGCPQETLSIVLEPTDKQVKPYDGQPLTAKLTGAEAFAIHSGSKISEIFYETEAGEPIDGAPVNEGVYYAVVTVRPGQTLGAPDYTLRTMLAIGQLNLADGTLALAGGDTYLYTGREISVEEVVKYAGQTLTAGTDYELDEASVTASVGSGVSNETYTVIVNGIGNYTNTLSVSWTIKGPEGNFPAPAKATGSEQGTLEGTTLAFYTDSEQAKTVANSGLTYYTAENAPDGSGVAGWYAGIKVSVPNSNTTFTKTSAMLFNYADELFTAEDCPKYGVLAETGKLDYPYVKGFTWWTRFEVADFDKALKEAEAAGDDQASIVRTLKATGLAWSGKSLAVLNVGSSGLKETTYTIELTFDKGQRYYDSEGHQLYPQHDHQYKFTVDKKGPRLVAACDMVSTCSYPQLSLWLKSEDGNYSAGYDATPYTWSLVASNTFGQVWTAMSVETFMDYTKSALLDGIIYTDPSTGLCTTNEAPVNAGKYRVTALIESWTNDTVAVTNTLTADYEIRCVPMTDCGIALDRWNFLWDGKQHTVAVVDVYQGSRPLVKGVDYEVDTNSVFTAVGEEGEDMSYPVTVKAIEGGNFYGERTDYWTITTGEGYYYDVLNPDVKTYVSALSDVLNRVSVANPIKTFLGKSYATTSVRAITVSADLAGRTKVLDLNGKTIVHDTLLGAALFDNKAVLTITDSVGGGVLSNKNWSATLIENEGTLTIEKGAYYGKLGNAGKLTVKDGVFTGDLVSGKASELLQAVTVTLEISGGTFNGDLAVNAGKATITGGTFEGKITKALLATVEISGGKFKADPGDYLKAGYVADKKDDGYWHVTPHVHAYTFQQIPAEGAVLLGECFTNAIKRIACAERVVKAELTAEDKDYDGEPTAAALVFSVKDSILSAEWTTISLEKYVELTGAVIGEISYSENGAAMEGDDPILPSADYQAEVTITVTNTVALTGEKEEKSFTLKKKFAITGAPFDKVEVVTTPNVADAIVYTGETVEIDISAFLDVGGKFPYELEEGVDYTVEGVTATNRIGTYTFKVVPDGICFKGEPKDFTWSIVEPTGSFAADALSAAVSEGAPAYAEVVEDTNLVITATTNLEYDAENACWVAGFEIKWPFDLEQVLRAPTYTDPEHAFVEFSTTNGVFSLADFAEGTVEVEGFDAFADQFYRIKTGHNETYVKGVAWIVPFTLDQVTNAVANGETNLTYSISVMSPAWENNKRGLKRTTYTITLPLDDNLVLLDDQGRQLYPVHEHEWTYELFADDDIVTNRLTATCAAADCPQGALTLALVADGDPEKEFDGQPLTAVLEGADEFAIHTGSTIGQICYETEGGLVLNGQPVAAGVYYATVTVYQDMTFGAPVYKLRTKLVIGERDLHRGYIELKGGSTYNYVGYAIDVDEDAMKVHYLGQTLVKDQDYTVNAESVFVATGSGVSNTTYKITVEGQGNYTNTLSYFWTILAPNGSFGRTDKATGFTGGEFADATTLVLTNANEVNYGLKYYTADEAPDGSGEAGWYAGIKVTVPSKNRDYTPASKMLFNDVDRDESFTGEACPYDGVSVVIAQVFYKYVTSFTWWTRVTLEDVTYAEGEDIVRTLKATGLAWKDGNYGSAGLAETTYQIVVKTEDLVLFDDRGVQIYPAHNHAWSYEVAEDAIRATCASNDCPVSRVELRLDPVVHEENGQPAAATLLGKESFEVHVGATFGEFMYFDLEGNVIAAPVKVGEYAVAVDVMLPCEDGTLSTNTLATTVSVVKTAGRDFDKGALEPYDFKDGNAGGYGEVVDGTNVVVTDSTKFCYDPSNTTWYAGVFVKLPNNSSYGIGNYSTDKDVFLSVSTTNGIYYADKIAAGEALTNELVEVKDVTAAFTYTYAIGWAVPLTVADVQAAREAGETEIVRSITIGANSREATLTPLDFGDSAGVKATTFNLVIPLENLVLVDENGNEVWPGESKVEASGVVTYPKAVKGSEFVREKTTSSWKAKANLGSVFGHWEWVSTNGAAPAAFLALSENERKKATLTVKIAAGEQVRPTDFAAVWYRIDEDTFGEVTLTPSNLVTESKSYVTATVSGLPSGMKFTAKSLAITGVPKKALQTKTVKVSLKNASGYTFKQSYVLTVGVDFSVALAPADDQIRTGVAVLTWADPTLGVNPALGKATGAKVYTVGKKASIRATPAKGEIFLGWYTDSAFANAATNLPKGYLTASQSVVVPAEGLELFARYVKLETWTVGTFDGVYFMGGEGSAPTGKVTLTVSSTGKVSGKTMFGGKSYSFSSVAFDDFIVEDEVGCFTAHVIEGTLKRALTIRVWCDKLTGLGNASIDYGTDENAPWAIAVQNGWKLKPAALPKFPTGKAALTPLTADGLTFKFNANGAVGVSGKLNGTLSVSQTAQLLPSEIAVPEELDGAPVTLYADFCVYVAPNKTKLPAGFCKIYPVQLTYQNGVFTSVAFDVEEE